MSTLSGFQNVTAQGELFLPRPRVSERRWDSDFAYPRYIETTPEEIGFRPFSVFSYLNALYDRPGVVGFKLMYAQLGLYPEILLYLIRHQVRVVHLIRKNHLDVIISYAIKAQIGQSHLLSGQVAPENIRIELDTNRLVKNLDQLRKKQSIARMVLVSFRLPHIEIAYEDLLRNQEHFRRIYEFLSINPEMYIRSPNVNKVRKGEHQDLIKNYDEVKETLVHSRFAALLD